MKKGSESSSRFKNLPKEDRPQERLEKLGASALSDHELLAMIIRSGTAKHDVLAIAEQLLAQAGSLSGLLKWDALDFEQIPGIGKVKSLQLSIQMEVAKRMAKAAITVYWMSHKGLGIPFSRNKITFG